MAVTLFTRFINLRNLVNVNNINAIGTTVNISQRLSTTPKYHVEGTEAVFNDDGGAPKDKLKQKMSSAMKAYLKRSQEYKEFMQKEIAEYNIGKRHLANIMGVNPETFKQKDVNKAIQYLFPSGLYHKGARPIMQHPRKLFPPKKAAQFDETGRPFHSLFYTTKPNYYQALYDIVDTLEELNKEEDKLLESGKIPDTECKIDTLTSSWFSQREIERKLLEPITTRDYEHLIATLEKLINHPLASHAQKVIRKYQRTLYSALKNVKVLPLRYTDDGKAYILIRSKY